MPRTDVVLVDGVWTQLGVTGRMIVTILVSGKARCFLNETNASPAALPIHYGRQGDQFEQTSATENTWAMAEGNDWTLTVDQ